MQEINHQTQHGFLIIHFLSKRLHHQHQALSLSPYIKPIITRWGTATELRPSHTPHTPLNFLPRYSQRQCTCAACVLPPGSCELPKDPSARPPNKAASRSPSNFIFFPSRFLCYSLSLILDPSPRRRGGGTREIVAVPVTPYRAVVVSYATRLSPSSGC